MLTSKSKDTECLISVIVPVYNVEQYLNRCIDSLRNQTYRNLEIILVDDGSTDNTGSLCDQFATEDERIQVVHKSNGGLSSARNTGIDKTVGDFITFIDSDDWISSDTYEYCLKLLGDPCEEAIEFNYIMVNEPCEVRQSKEIIHVFHEKDILQYYLMSTTKTGSYSVCRCLFPSKAIKNLRFLEGKINEDIDFKYKALQQCCTLITTNQYKYFYFQSGNSLSTGGLKKKDFDLYEAAEELLKLTQEEEFGAIKKLGEVKVARTPFSLLSKIAYNGIQDPSVKSDNLKDNLIREHKKNLRTLIASPMPFSRKVLAIGFAINYPFSERVVRIYKIMK